MDVRVERYLRALVGEARNVLAEQLVGAYATGSVALDAYDPGRSDVDVALLTATELVDTVKRDLASRLRHEALPCPARGLELVVYRREVAGSGTVEPGFELELNSGARMSHRVTLHPDDRPEQDGLFWYALDRSVLHQCGLRLTGPPAAEVFTGPGTAEVRQLLVTALRWWATSPLLATDEPSPGADDAVLAGCRALARHRTGRWTAKVEAGRWLLATTDHDDAPDTSGLVARAVAARTGGPPPSGREARAFLQRIVHEIEGSSDT